MGGMRRIRLVVLAGALLLTAPFWLPSKLGGETFYTYILSNSMEPTFSRGALVVLRPSDEYRVGQVAGYWLEGEEGRRSIIVHRVVGRLPSGDYLFKGDANPTAEVVRADQVIGRSVLVAPYLGWGLMVFQVSPHLFIFLTVAALALQRALRTDAPEGTRGRTFPWFFMALTVVGLSAPVMQVGMVERIGVLPMVALLVGILVVVRAVEPSVRGRPALQTIVVLNYILVMGLALASVPIWRVVQQIRDILS